MILIGILYAVFAAMTFINSKLMLTNPYPFFVGMLRAFGSFFFLFNYIIFYNRRALNSLTLPAQGWRDLLIFGALVHGVVMCGFSYCVQYADPVKVCFIFATAPFITAMLQYFSGHEILTIKKIFGLLVGFCGVLPVLLASDHEAYAHVPPYLERIGTILCFFIIVLFAYGWIRMKRFLSVHGHHPMTIINSIAMFVGGSVSLILFLITQKFNVFNMYLTEDFSYLMFAFVLSSTLTYMIYAHLLKTYSATFIAFTGFLEPVFALLYGIAYMGHKLTWATASAVVILFIGLYLFYKEELKLQTNVMLDPNV